MEYIISSIKILIISLQIDFRRLIVDIEKEREAFEAHCESIGLGVVTQKVAGIFANSIIRTTWSGWLSCAESKQSEIDNLKTQLEQAKAQAVPDGFVLVPKEPTRELLNTMQDFFVGAFENGLTGGQSIHCAYKAMIEALEQSYK